MVAIALALTSEERDRLGSDVTLRAIAVRAYEEAWRERWPFLSDVFARVLRGVHEEEAGIVAAAVHALVKYHRLLGFACGDAAGQAAKLEMLLALARGECREVDARLDALEGETERLGTAYSMPDWLVDLVRTEVGTLAFKAALARMNETAPRVARVNTLRTTRDDLRTALAGEGLETRSTQTAQTGLAIDGRRSPFRTQAFARGDFEMQDEASQMVAELVAPPPRTRVIDACAGAGGKALALAALLDGKGEVIALDPSGDKLKELRRRARRAGANNVRALECDLLATDDRIRGLQASATRVLVDAPCTGVGAIRRNPEARWRLGVDELVRLLERQRALLDGAARLVVPHGRIVFATCSFLPSEGSNVVEEFLARQAGYSLVTAREVLGGGRARPMVTTDGKYLSTWRFDGADDAQSDGFFAAVLRKARPVPR
ncbi:MAG: RsmB/NOP family class I SAM-dependent RNA methyltransferase [Polyangiaceae bacterium]|jgi:16S rRNA (cytosine967-C5)-methyltransferase